ncbi:MAG: ATP-binding protein [Nitrospiraceae bacterium]
MDDFNYLQLIKHKTLPPLSYPRYRPLGFKELTTSHPAYRDELEQATKKLNTYFKTASKTSSPLNCLILGPPGAGKTYLVKQLAKSLEVPVPFHELNVSLSSDPKSMLEELAKHSGEPKLVFIDEFDVTIAGSSVVRFLLDPMTSKKHHQTAFVFSGSYLKSLPILQRLNSKLSDFDLPRFLLDLIAKTDDTMQRKELGRLYSVCCLHQDNRSGITPDSDEVQYLNTLHKLRDFLSRINGFIVQIPDITSPMMITDHPLQLHDSYDHEKPGKDVIQLLSSKTAGHVRLFVDATKSWSFRSPNNAILQYKHMLLTERFGLVKLLLDEYVQKQSGNRKAFFIQRQDLNYLIMAPLQHNVRSLRFLIEQCINCVSITKINHLTLWTQLPEGHYFLPFFLELDVESDSAALHVGKEPYFQNPARLWSFLRASNCTKEQFPDGEELLCLSEIRNVLTVYLCGDATAAGLDSLQQLLALYMEGDEQDRLFHSIQVIPASAENREGIAIRGNGTFETVPRLKNIVLEDTLASQENFHLLSRSWGEYVLFLTNRNMVTPNFVTRAIKAMTDSSSNHLRHFVYGKDGTDKNDDGEHPTTSNLLLCQTRTLKEHIRLDPGLAWPLDPRFLENPAVKKKVQYIDIENAEQNT